MGRRKASKTVETVVIVYYIHTATVHTVQAGGVEERTSHFQGVEECTEGTYSPYCSGYSRGVGTRQPPQLHLKVIALGIKEPLSLPKVGIRLRMRLRTFNI
jgi:hypothetical protein